MANVDIVVLGAGPGGYAAAFYAADKGRKVMLVEQDDRLGGNDTGVPGSLPVSASTGIGIDRLRAALERELRQQGSPIDLELPYSAVGSAEALRARHGLQLDYGATSLHVRGFAPPAVAAELQRLQRRRPAGS